MLHVDKASDGFGRATVLVRLDMSKLRVPYKSGDHVAIQPPNTALEPQLKKFLKALGRDADAIFEAKKPPGVDAVSKERYPLLHEVLGHKHTVGNVFLTMAAVGDVVSPQACDQLADFAKDPDRQRLREAAVDVDKHKELAKTKGLQWVNIFEDFPSLKSGKVPMELLLMLIPVIRPRLYSVASSPVQEPGELHLVVGRLVYKTGDGKKRLGVCSNFFSKLDAKDEGLAEVRFQVRPCTSFRLPPDLLSPIIMVATGTGLAPFRGFMQERLALAKANNCSLGPAALIVGCKNKAELLLQEELKQATAGGAVTMLLEAFSREPGQPKCYVQDRVRQDAGKLRPLLENPKCEVYLCGGSEMAGDVKKALEDVCSGCVEKLETSGRLHEDLFGIISVTS
uniref:NADPH--hemoprotein reductase n=1 Tax=Pyrodinium bahamense TaxID=73915 RepID=A0A7S0FDS6_9DINO|mmetsp:Transcript_23656/g.65443  ORF Transcript_23656/g.65443 Transcript_23656/m.65443 type:complete len:396 (+) Transcript_23656:3-1190(+)